MPYRGDRELHVEVAGGGAKRARLILWTKAVLYPDIKGQGLQPDARNPSVPVSSFRFEPYSPGGQ